MTTTLSGQELPRTSLRGGEQRGGNGGGERRRVLIISPHFPPSNLAAVHRTRLFARHLPEFGWEPIVLTVHHEFYEERLDWELAKLVPSELRVEAVRAIPTKPVRIVGDIGIRGFSALCRRSLELIDELAIDFLYIPIPSFYAAPLGRIIHSLRGIPYGIDYIDPWVHAWAPEWPRFTKHWMSWKLGALLEPIAVRRAALITGVAPGYYQGVLERNPHLAKRAITAAMPYGGDESDHDAVSRAALTPYLFNPTDRKRHLVYAGAMLPRAFDPLERIFRAIAGNRDSFENVTIHFIGTGKSPDDAAGYNVRPLAERYGLWGDIVHEHPPRIPYLDVLVHLHAAAGVFILGSTEPHYTPSKVFQGVLSGKPILAILHQASTACSVLRETGAGCVLSFDGERELDHIEQSFVSVFAQFSNFSRTFDASQVDRSRFEPYTARSTTRVLAQAMNAALTCGGRRPDATHE